MLSVMHKAGFVNIVGNPNVGKSTLMNLLVGERISIATFKAQTTRHRIMGIVNTPEMQIVFSDTPGVLKPNYKLQESMLAFSESALQDADILLYVTDVVENLDCPIGENIVLPSLNALAKGTFISPKSERKLSDGEIDSFRIKCYGGRQWVNTLSGGNKQKVSFSKWTAKKSDVLIMDCPTRGVDIGVKQFMYHVIAEMKQQGKSIILISEELGELIGMADKILIMKDFEVTHQVERSPELKQTDLIEYMI